jgi:FMN phosphatase YigB (HAD superfamily)
MKKVKYLCFDMDGTIADLYGVIDWHLMLKAELPTPYKTAKPMWDMLRLKKALEKAQAQGIEVCVITWLSMNSSNYFKREVRKAKLEWLKVNDFPYNRFSAVQYGTTKANSIRKFVEENESAILFDDNEKVRNGWHLGETVDPTTTDIIEFIERLVE